MPMPVALRRDQFFIGEGDDLGRVYPGPMIQTPKFIRFSRHLCGREPSRVRIDEKEPVPPRINTDNKFVVCRIDVSTVDEKHVTCRDHGYITR